MIHVATHFDETTLKFKAARHTYVDKWSGTDFVYALDAEHVCVVNRPRAVVFKTEFPLEDALQRYPSWIVHRDRLALRDGGFVSVDVSGRTVTVRAETIPLGADVAFRVFYDSFDLFYGVERRRIEFDVTHPLAAIALVEVFRVLGVKELI